MKIANNHAFVAIKKQYSKPQAQIVCVEPYALLIPTSDPDDPHLLPKGHFVPGPGASYAPPANII